ncbi:MAG: hypothetical protein KUG81_03665 [Gammaproteobacteria bacterium]|nr:hypothetical protein [Gammaproteobacteria bacterium]
MSANSNLGILNDTKSLTVSGRLTIPVASLSQTPPQRKGSLIIDPLSLKLYYSDGVQWLEVFSTGGGNIACIQDGDNDTSVCTDTDPNTITFVTSGTERAQITSTGDFIVGSVPPVPGNIAHFGGNIKISGIVGPDATQFEEQTDHPVDPTGTSTGVLWVRDDNPNVLVFTDNTGVDAILSGGGAVTDLSGVLTVGNFTGGNDIVLTTGDEIVGLTDVTISGADTTGGSGGSININAGSDSTTGTGGDININSGDSVSGVPGDVNISSTGDINLVVPPGNSVNISGVLDIAGTTVQTTDNTLTLLETIPLNIPDRIYSVTSKVTARSNNTGATFRLDAAFHRDAGVTVRQMGSTTRDEHKDNPNWFSNFAVGASVVEVYVIGVNLATIDWKSSTKLHVSD